MTDVTDILQYRGVVASKNQDTLHQFLRSKSVTSWRLPRCVADKVRLVLRCVTACGRVNHLCM